MPTPSVSGTSSFVYARDKLIKRALIRIGAIDAEDTPGANLINEGAEVLNLMTKEWQASGIHVWTETEAILFLQQKQTNYLLGGSTTDHCVGATQWTQDFCLNTMAAGATVIPLLDGAEAILNANQIGVTLDSGAFFWTTVNGAPAGGSVTLAQALPSQASAGNSVVAYTPANAIVRPLRIPAGRRYAFAPLGGQPIETPMLRLARQDYMDLPNKTNTGTVTQFFYSPQIGSGQLGPGNFYAWPAPPDVSSAVRFTWYRPIDDWNTAADIGDFPVESSNALGWNLAVQLIPEYGVITPQQVASIEKRAAESLDIVAGWDRESESILMQPDMQRMSM